MLPVDSNARKDIPIWSGVLRYFPDAIAAVARISKLGNDKHNPGEPLHWARGKSMDQEDCCVRHLLELGTIDEDDGALHDAKLAWRALANLQLVIESRTEKGLPIFDEEIIARNKRRMTEKMLAAAAKLPSGGEIMQAVTAAAGLLPPKLTDDGADHEVY